MITLLFLLLLFNSLYYSNMLTLILGIIVRIFSNSYLNVFQKILTNKGEASSVVNLYTYLGLTLLGVMFCPHPIFSEAALFNILIMGLLGAIGNYFIIKALSEGELSTLAPINSYKPIIALFFGFFLLKEVPQCLEIIGIFFIIGGTFFLGDKRILYNKATLYRFLALIFSGTEAIFIKKVIIMSDVLSAFLFWASAGLIFSFCLLILSKHKINIKSCNIKYQLLLIFMVALMQYSTNYIFSKMNVAYALALFQLSTIVSVFLGVNIFKEKGLLKKVFASLIMIIGAIILILS